MRLTGQWRNLVYSLYHVITRLSSRLRVPKHSGEINYVQNTNFTWGYYTSLVIVFVVKCLTETALPWFAASLFTVWIDGAATNTTKGLYSEFRIFNTAWIYCHFIVNSIVLYLCDCIYILIYSFLSPVWACHNELKCFFLFFKIHLRFCVALK